VLIISSSLLVSVPCSKLDVKVPELIIIGAQSKGKSSIVEGISLQMFNFTRPDIASRFPIHFRMIYSPRHVHPTWRIVRDQEVLEEGRTTQQVAAFVERTNETLQAQRAVDSNPVLLELRWNNCPNLSFIDLPGLRSLATDENEAMLQQQIESMARYIITTKHRSAHATFLVVEEAKDDIANFHGLSKVFEMLAHARHSPEPAASSSSATSSESNPWFGEDEDRCKFVLVLNKLDQFINNSDGSVDDKRAKIQTIVKKFEPKGIPVFFTSLPTSQMKQEFKAEPTELRAAEAFATAIRECSERDRTEMGHIVPEYVWLVIRHTILSLAPTILLLHHAHQIHSLPRHAPCAMHRQARYRQIDFRNTLVVHSTLTPTYRMHLVGPCVAPCLVVSDSTSCVALPSIP